MRILRWGGVALGGVAGAVLVACAAVYFVSEYALRQRPNLTYSIRHYSTADIVTAIPKGVRPDRGTTMAVSLLA